MEFNPFPKLHRLSRDIVVTEKLDGTNAQIFIEDETLVEDRSIITAVVDGLALIAGSRNRWITPESDNFGFARWVRDNAEALAGLGIGAHFGEWWGKGIQRGYGLDERRFSLFNTARWYDHLNHQRLTPAGVDVVPILYMGEFDTDSVDACLQDLSENGSVAVAGFMKPEGVVVFHTHSRALYKKTLDNNDEHKWMNKS